MNTLAFADAARPSPAVILKLQMLDYSIGHELLLHKQRNPLVTATPDEFNKLPNEQQRVAVIRAALCCCRTWEDNKRPHRWLKFWSWRNWNADFALAIADFRNYRMLGSSVPMVLAPLRDRCDGDRELGSPLLARLLAVIISSRIWPGSPYDCPLGLAMWMYFTEAENEGACRIENTYEKQLREEIAQHEADYAREAEKKGGEPCQP